MAKRKTRTPEEHAAALLKMAHEDIESTIERGMLPLNPTRTFEVDERVHWGAHKEVYVREIFSDGLYYKVESVKVSRGRDDTPHSEFHVQPWMDLYKWQGHEPTTFRVEETHFIRLSNSSLSSLLGMVYGSHAGVEFDVEYQRDHVWEIKDKVDLIDSIFNNIDIGKFVFVQRAMKHDGKLYEIIDGKQRLTALCEFYEDRFKYKGYYYSQLSGNDKGKFNNHGVAYGQLEDPGKRGIYETFIKLNTCGKPMDHKYIENVKKLLKNLEE